MILLYLVLAWLKWVHPENRRIKALWFKLIRKGRISKGTGLQVPEEGESARGRASNSRG